ncbi:hypothetical protein P2318_20090 [Myxococcaceae bacterium GXIMD 01537]
MRHHATQLLVYLAVVSSLSLAGCSREETPEARSRAVAEAALLATEVSAGPDVSGWANEALTLNGSVTTDAGALGLSWSFAAAEGTEPGATCTFSTPGTASTTVSCTHEGSYTVTLTASDGVNAPVPASAVVTLRSASKVTLCNLPRYTKQTSLRLCGTALPGLDGTDIGSAWFTVNGGAPIPVALGAGGFVDTTTTLTEGNFIVRLSALSKAGHLTLLEKTVTVDLTPPTLTVLSPTSSDLLESTIVAVRSSVEDATPVRVQTQRSQNTTVESGVGVVTHTIDLVSRGFSNLLVSATDAVGNVTEVRLRVYVRTLTCGNGVRSGTELCDDGNVVTETSCPPGQETCTACDATCSIILHLTGVRCGDGVANGSEVCDDGNTVTETTCPDGEVSCTRCDAACSTVLHLTGRCTEDAQCGAGHLCDAGTCVAKRPNGEACDTSRQCDSGTCADGVCCDSACEGACDACDQPGSEGMCIPVAAGGTGSPTCGPFVCDGTSAACPTTCVNNAQCASGSTCFNGTCTQKLPNGASCGTAGQCASGNCVDGVCCNTACNGGACDACNLPGSIGTCGFLPSSVQCRASAGVCDQAEFCTGASAACPADAQAPNGTTCGDPSVGGWGVCGGFSGVCGEAGSQSRSVTTFACSSGACTPSTMTESMACGRDTDGQSCGGTTVGEWGACTGFSGVCGESGTQYRTVTTSVCTNGGCQQVSQPESQSCSRDTDGQSCGGTSTGGWGACTGFSGVCGESGTQERTVTASVCSNGGCQQVSHPEYQSCSRDTDGQSCGGTSSSGWSPCTGFSGVCGESGTQYQTVTTSVCSNGGCQQVSHPESRSCSRDTDGQGCGEPPYPPSVGAWGACTGFSGVCGESGTQYRTVTSYACSGGGCQSSSYTESQPCSRDTDGLVCGNDDYGAWDACGGFSDTCDRDGSQGRPVTHYRCQSGGCTGIPGSSQSQSCSRDTSGWSCNDGDACTQGDSCNSSGSCQGTTLSCPGGQCSGGTCTCAPGLTWCDGGCVNLSWDFSHCGSCGNRCPYALYQCHLGVCEIF